MSTTAKFWVHSVIWLNVYKKYAKQIHWTQCFVLFFAYCIFRNVCDDFNVLKIQQEMFCWDSCLLNAKFSVYNNIIRLSGLRYCLCVGFFCLCCFVYFFCCIGYYYISNFLCVSVIIYHLCKLISFKLQIFHISTEQPLWHQCTVFRAKVWEHLISIDNRVKSKTFMLLR